MRFARRFRPSPAMVVACIALAVALGGTSYAAIKLARNSVGTIQLKKNAVTSPKVKNNALTGADIKEATLSRVPLAALVTTATTATTATHATAARPCNGLRSSGHPPGQRRGPGSAQGQCRSQRLALSHV